MLTEEPAKPLMLDNQFAIYAFMIASKFIVTAKLSPGWLHKGEGREK